MYNQFTKIKIIAFISCLLLLEACFFFRKKGTGDSLDENNNTILGKPLGSRASGANFEKLEQIYGITTAHAPAEIRPDPDTIVRNILLQYRPEGATVAQTIGRVDAYRQLLGGASEDFSKEPQDRYDATSLLTLIKVGEEICTALVNPNPAQHGSWQTILPEPADDVDSNIRFLINRLTGIHSNKISTSQIDQLKEIFYLAQAIDSTNYAPYVAVCTTVLLDAEVLLL